MFFLLLIFFSSSYFCSYSLTITSNTPQRTLLHLNELEILCINSTLPFLTVTFEHTNLLNVRYFSSSSSSNTSLHREGRFVFPSESVGVSFTNVLGHIEVRAALTGFLAFSAFAFPISCGENRYFTSLLNDHIPLSSERHSNRICLWSPHPNYTISGLASEKGVFLCRNADDCTFPSEKAIGNRRTISVTSEDFVEFEVAPTFIAGVRIRRAGRFLPSSGWLTNEGRAAVLTVALAEK
jgi:hypothetical protein